MAQGTSITDFSQPRLPDEHVAELTASFGETAEILFSAGNPAETLQSVVDLAVETIEGCDFAGIFVLGEDGVTTPALTDPLVVQIDAAQHRCGEGPCLDAIAQGGTYYADELVDDSRWPLFGPEASKVGIRSALALRLSSNGTRGALNLYASYPQAFGVVDRAKALILASLAGIALSAAESHANEERRYDELQAALVTREVIGQAEGILIERERITAEQAFVVLRRASQHLNIKLRDVARDLVDTGERPQTGPDKPAK
jgi:GAF domain-containing protein